MSSIRSFYSKILLFGEYSIIREGKGLCLPYKLFEGALRFDRSQQKSPDQELMAFGKYLKKLQETETIDFELDADSLLFDVAQGLFFDSTIPQGFGVGSSGALCAAVFDRYGKKPFEPVSELLTGDQTEILKNIFSKMESHFHGNSSGIDPLISFLGEPFLIKKNCTPERVHIPSYKDGEGKMFLLNTARARRTEPLVNLFLEKCKSSSFRKRCEETLLPVTDACISNFLNKNAEVLISEFCKLSTFQAENFSEMIPNLYKDLWDEGIKHEHFFLKLCGAGGGGFLLGIAPDYKKARKYLEGHEMRPLFSL